MVSEALKHNVNLETSSAFDIDLILNLLKEKKIDKKRAIICNGYKTTEYLQKIISLQESGFSNIIVVLDGMSELDRLTEVAGTNIIKSRYANGYQ